MVVKQMVEAAKVMIKNIEGRIEESKEAIRLARKLGVDVTKQEIALLEQERRLKEIKKILEE